MPEVNDLFSAPLESVQRPKSNVERFPTIGAHLIDEGTQAYAKTEPPEPEAQDADGPAVSTAQPQVFSQWAPVKNLFFIAVGYLWVEHKAALLALAAALVGAGALIAMAAGWVPHFPLG